MDGGGAGRHDGFASIDGVGRVMLTFRSYLRIRRLTNTRIGIFTREARADRNLPEINSWEELRAYLCSKGARRDVLDAGYRVWVTFVRMRERGGPKKPGRQSGAARAMGVAG